MNGNVNFSKWSINNEEKKPMEYIVKWEPATKYMMATISLKKMFTAKRETGAQGHNYSIKFIYNQRKQQLAVVQRPY